MDGLNLYRAFRGNPIGYVDAEGKQGFLGDRDKGFSLSPAAQKSLKKQLVEKKFEGINAIILSTFSLDNNMFQSLENLKYKPIQYSGFGSINRIVYEDEIKSHISSMEVIVLFSHAKWEKNEKKQIFSGFRCPENFLENFGCAESSGLETDDFPNANATLVIAGMCKSAKGDAAKKLAEKLLAPGGRYVGFLGLTNKYKAEKFMIEILKNWSILPLDKAIKKAGQTTKIDEGDIDIEPSTFEDQYFIYYK